MAKPKEDLQYDSSAKVSSKGTAILGRLTGPCADTINPTRNGRKYSNELWEKVFKDPLVQEQFSNGGIFGEMNHPADRDEVDLTQVCVCMPEPPKKNDKGELIASWDILDTPNGRILKTLCDYGYKLGISSRGSGEIETDYDGNESVDPDSYQLNAWDIVLIPAVKAARLDYVTESVNNKKTLKQALVESLNSANDSDRKIMEETLDNLHIEIGQEDEKSSDDIKAVDNNEAIVEELQNSTKQVQTLQKKVISLQEKLSVSYAEESKKQEEIVKLRTTIQKLSEDVKKKEALQNQVRKLNDKISEFDKKTQELNKQLEAYEAQYQKGRKDYTVLNESIQIREREIEALKSRITALNKKNAALSKERADKEKELTENLETLKKDSAQKTNQYSQKLDSANKLVEKYKKIANTAVDKYIQSEAIKIGVTPEEVKNRLPQSYTFKDIDAICEDLQSYKISVNKLPFRMNENIKVKTTESKHEPILPANVVTDDDVDSSLIEMAGLI